MDIGLVIIWLVATAGLWLIGIPICTILFPTAPDRGISFSLPLIATLFILVAYWIGHVNSNTPGFIAALLLIIVIAVFAARRTPTIPWSRGLEPAIVFLAAFTLLLLIRATAPAIHPAGGEKFLDFALLQTVLRSPTLPPVDPWFAGNSLRYYYGGHLVGALLTELTHTSPRYAYNLLVPWFYATLATTTYGLGGWLAYTNNHSYRTGGLLGVLVVGFAGNLATPARMTLQFLPRDIIATYGHSLLGAIRDPYPELVDQYAAGEFFAWDARYVIPDTPNVFPMWTFTNGDLRPHMMSAPLLVLGIALLYTYYTTPTTNRRHRQLITWVALPILTGALALVNTWALPTLWGVLVLTLGFAPTHPSRLLPPRIQQAIPDTLRSKNSIRNNNIDLFRWGLAPLISLSVLAIGAALAAPHLLWHTPIHQGIGFLPPRSNLAGLVLVHGAFLGLFLLYYRTQLRNHLPTDSRIRTIVIIVVVFLVLAGLVVLGNLAAVALFGPLFVLAWWHYRNASTSGFESVLVIAGVGLVLIVEFTYAQVYPHDPRAPRWNTIYKVYHQTWIIWGLAAAPITTALLDTTRPTTKTRQFTSRLPRLKSSHLVVALAVILVVCSLTFGVLVTATTVGPYLTESNQPPLSLNGTAFVLTEHPEEATATRWLQTHDGQPTMVSQPTRTPYQWRNGIGASAGSSLSGIPTVVGWSHEIGYRGEAAFEQRARDVDRLYTGTNHTTTRLLSKYKVALIYMGPHETRAYGQTNFSSIPGVTVAHSSGDVTMYRVNHSELRPLD